MKDSKTRIWMWKQADGSELKVVSNLEKGTIYVYNKIGKCVLEKKNLTPDQVRLIEQYFLTIVTQTPITTTPKKDETFDPMIT
jgi:hypothetical protein